MSGEARSWVLCGGYLVLLAASLPLGPGIVVALRQQELLGFAVSAVYFGSAALLAHYVLFDGHLSDRVAFWSLVLVAALAGAFLLGLRVPEERVHFFQYGVLGLLLRSALCHRNAPLPSMAIGALLASGIGLADELIQGWLPNRHFDSRDIGLNAVGAVLALVGDEALHRRVWPRAGSSR